MSYRPKYLGHVNVFVRNAEQSCGRPGAAREDAPGPGSQKKQVGLNHMAWVMGSLEDLRERYQRLKDKGVPVERVSDHGISVGICLRDPDSNGVEVSDELPRGQWPRQERFFAEDLVDLGRFQGPWDEDPTAPKIAAR
jgi:hypothetical protein